MRPYSNLCGRRQPLLLLLLSALLLGAFCPGEARPRNTGSTHRGANNFITKWNINRPLNFTLSMFEYTGLAQFADIGTGGSSSRRFRLLEVGCGEGRALLELQLLLPNAELYCLNHPTYGRSRGFGGANVGDTPELLRPVARNWGIPLPHDSRLPAVKFGDAFQGEWPWPDGFFDAVVSVNCFTKDPALGHSIAEAGRVLAPAGRAFLHTHLSVNVRDRGWPLAEPGCQAYMGPEPTVAGCGEVVQPPPKRARLFLELGVQRWAPRRPQNRGTAASQYIYHGTLTLQKQPLPEGRCPQPHVSPDAVKCLDHHTELY